MPATEVFLADIGLIAVKIETTEGTAATPLSTDAFLAEEVSFTPSIEMHSRKVLAQDLSPYTEIAGKRSATVKFKTLLKGSGTATTASEFGELFKLCKFGETVGGADVTYAPVSSGDSSGTIALYINVDASNGKKYIFNGCRGNFKIPLVNGAPVYVEWEFTAADFTESSSSPLTGMSYDTTTALIFQNATFSVDGRSFDVSKMDIDAGNAVSLRANPSGSGSASGHLSAVITDVEPVGNFDPIELYIATYDMYGKWRAMTTGALTCNLGSTSGNIVEISAPVVQYTSVSPSDRDGMRVLDTNLKFCRSAGNDHLKILTK